MNGFSNLRNSGVKFKSIFFARHRPWRRHRQCLSSLISAYRDFQRIKLISYTHLHCAARSLYILKGTRFNRGDSVGSKIPEQQNGTLHQKPNLHYVRMVTTRNHCMITF